MGREMMGDDGRCTPSRSLSLDLSVSLSPFGMTISTTIYVER